MSRQAVLAVLERAASDTSFLAELADRPTKVLKDYELDLREVAVLVSGDIKALEEWLGKLDERLLKRPKCRLQQLNPELSEEERQEEIEEAAWDIVAIHGMLKAAEANSKKHS